MNPDLHPHQESAFQMQIPEADPGDQNHVDPMRMRMQICPPECFFFILPSPPPPAQLSEICKVLILRNKKPTRHQTPTGMPTHNVGTQ
jgi:hypothetical protein